jgi:hypothetical protein
MRVIGWLQLLLALVFWMSLVIHYVTRSRATYSPLEVATAALATVFGLFLVAAGESIKVLFTIEDNTRAAAEHLYKMVSEKSPPKT